MFPEHYTDTAKAVLSIPGWVARFTDDPGWGDDWYHPDTDTSANVDADTGEISTYPPVEGDDGMSDYWTPGSPAYAF